MRALTGKKLRSVVTSFAGSATVVQVSAGGLRYVRSFHANYIGAPAASDGPLSLNNTIVTSPGSGEKLIQVPQTGANAGKVALTRAAGTTAGISVSLVLEGY